MMRKTPVRGDLLSSVNHSSVIGRPTIAVGIWGLRRVPGVTLTGPNAEC